MEFQTGILDLPVHEEHPEILCIFICRFFYFQIRYDGKV